MSRREMVAGLTLAAGSALISVAILNIASSEGAFIFEWVGSFLAFYGLSYLTGPRASIALSGVVLVIGSVGDMILLGGMTPLSWALINYMVFVHSAAGALAGYAVKRETSSEGSYS